MKIDNVYSGIGDVYDDGLLVCFAESAVCCFLLLDKGFVQGFPISEYVHRRINLLIFGSENSNLYICGKLKHKDYGLANFIKTALTLICWEGPLKMSKRKKRHSTAWSPEFREEILKS